MDTIPYSDLRAHLAETLKQLEVREEPVFISRRGEHAAVLMSVAQYERLQRGQSGFGQALLAWRERHAAELAAEADAAWQDPFADVRDRGSDGGRPPMDWMEILSAQPEVTKGKPSATPKAKAKAIPTTSTRTMAKPQAGARSRPTAAQSLRWLLDTNTLSEPVRPRPNRAVVQSLLKHPDELALPATVLQELHFGWLRMAEGRQRLRVGDYLRGTVAELPVLPLDAAAARVQAQVRLHAVQGGRPMSYADSEIAAIAIANGLTLVTRNTRDFEAQPGLRLANWFED